MKTFIIYPLLAATIISSCANKKEQSKEGTTSDTSRNEVQVNTEVKQPVSVNETVTAYLHLKNALVNDNGKEAATAGKQITESLGTIDTSALTSDQKKVFNEIKEDIKEHAEHIAAHADKLEHQRDHFDMLSEDMYDLVKAIKPAQTLYVAFCPMYNDKKGATWLSEIKEIKNPYYGKKMISCGEVKEEIK